MENPAYWTAEQKEISDLLYSDNLSEEQRLAKITSIMNVKLTDTIKKALQSMIVSYAEAMQSGICGRSLSSSIYKYLLLKSEQEVEEISKSKINTSST